MITDVFSLAETTADELRWADDPRRRWPCLRAHGIGPKELARLGEGLGVGPFEDVLEGFSFLAGESQESPWVVAVPRALSDRLIQLGGAEILPAVARWREALGGRTELSEERLVGYLRDLQCLLSDDDGPFALYISSQEQQQEVSNRR